MIDWHGITKNKEERWNYPYINPDTGTWWEWSAEQNAYVNTEINALGYTGETGEQGERGPKGNPGTSVYVTSITPSSVDGGGNVVTFSDGTSMTVYNGSKGAAGPAGRDGVDGLPGADGSTGPQGPKGDPGTPGAGVTVVDVTESDDDGGTNLITFSDGSVLAVKNGNRGSQGPMGMQGNTGPQGISGEPGTDGVTPHFSIGTVAKGVDPVVTVTGTDAEPVLNFTLPKGDAYEITSADYQEIAGVVTEDIAAIKDDAIDAIEQKGEDVIESIPPDYTTLSNRVTVLEPAAVAGDVGKALVVKTVSNGKATSYEFGEAGGGGGGIFYGVCSTSGSSETKVVTVDNSFALENGAVVYVRFSYSNTHASAKLDVNGTGAKNIKLASNIGLGNSSCISWEAGEVVTLVYDSTLNAWMLCGPNHIYSRNNGYTDGIFMYRPVRLLNGAGSGTADMMYLSFNVGAPIIGSVSTVSYYGGIYTADGAAVYVHESDGSNYPLVDYEFGDLGYNAQGECSANGNVTVWVDLPNSYGEGYYFCKGDGTMLHVGDMVWWHGMVYVQFT